MKTTHIDSAERLTLSAAAVAQQLGIGVHSVWCLHNSGHRARPIRLDGACLRSADEDYTSCISVARSCGVTNLSTSNADDGLAWFAIPGATSGIPPPYPLRFSAGIHLVFT